MQDKIINLGDLRFNLETWRRELRFHFDEMDNFQDRLEETVHRGTDATAKKSLENFQNRIMIEKSVISKLKHRCKAQLRNIDYMVNTDIELGDDMRTYIKMHYDLKEEMMDFFSIHLHNHGNLKASTN